MAASSQDKLVWMGAKHGAFDLKSAYRIALSLGPSQPFHGKWVWDLKTLPRIQTFLWKCCHHSIGVKSALYQEVWLWTPLVLYATVVWNKLYMLFETVLSLCLFGIIWESQAAVASPFLKTFRPG